MRTVEDVRTTDARFPGVVATVGCFDGVHLGHQQILDALLEESRAIGGTAAVMTLEPHPRQYFFPENAPNILTDARTKRRLLEERGVDVVYTLPFDRDSAAMSAQQFVESILVGQCKVEKVVVGHDFAFGHDASGDYEYLTTAARRHGFEVRQIPPLIIGGQRVSSTLIRERVIQGEVCNLEQYLGRKFSLTGTVIAGRGIGRILGFPTANLDVGTCATPAHGVYAAEAFVRDTRYVAAVNIGIAPTIRDEHALVEAHLLDYTGDLDVAEIEIAFHKRLRPEKKFASRDALSEAIAADVQCIREYFSRMRPQEATRLL